MRNMVVLVLLGLGASAIAQSFITEVRPQEGEDLAQSCHYELTLVSKDKETRGVWVIYDRGPQITSFYKDSSVIALARKRHLALLLAHQCNSIDAPGGSNEIGHVPLSRSWSSALHCADPILTAESASGTLYGTTSPAWILRYRSALCSL